MASGPVGQIGMVAIMIALAFVNGIVL